MNDTSGRLLRPIAIWRGAFAGLVGIVPIAIAVELIDRYWHDLDRSTWLVLPYLLILFVYMIAGFGAAAVGPRRAAQQRLARRARHVLRVAHRARRGAPRVGERSPFRSARRDRERAVRSGIRDGGRGGRDAECAPDVVSRSLPSDGDTMVVVVSRPGGRVRARVR